MYPEIKMVRHCSLRSCLVGTVAILSAFAMAAHANDDDEAYHYNYIFGAPSDPGPAWTLAVGGRLYDNWAVVLDTELPDDTHPLWPAANTAHEGGDTWRCKACHGWDYRGADGKYATGSYATGITGVAGMAGAEIDAIMALLGEPAHGYTDDLLPVEAKRRLATFISQGLDDMPAYVDLDGTVTGEAETGRDIFQNVCASCHGFEGKALDWGEPGEPAYVGTEANDNPWEVFHKIRNGHPGTEMIALRGFGPEVAAAVLAYAQTLPID
jgi:mono/diheme cytochrome c family protein